MSVGFDNIDGHDSLWSHYRAGKLAKHIQEIVVTPALMRKLNVKRLQLRTRMYQDEEADCREEIRQGHVLKRSFKGKGETKDIVCSLVLSTAASGKLR